MMESFSKFLNLHNELELVLNEFNAVAPSTQAAPMTGFTNQQNVPIKEKPWSAKKDEIMQMWRNLRADTPIIIQPLSDQPVTPGGEKSTFGEDGIRITGSWQFISSILSRIKELSFYENPQTRLRLVFRGVDKTRARPDKQSFVFYLNLEKRNRGRAGRPNKIKPAI